MYENITPEKLKRDALLKLEGWNKKEGSFADIVVSGVMYEVWKWYAALNGLIPMFYIDETSGEYIDRRCGDYGIFRKPGETDKQLVERFYAFLQHPATSGNVYHYEQWALSVPGVGFAKIFPLWNGNGTVKVVLAGADGRSVSPQIIEDAAEYIEGERPIGAAVTVAGAQERRIDIAASAVLMVSADADTIRDGFEAALDEYFQTLTLQANLVSHSRLVYALLDIPGVLDVVSLTANGGSSSNISLLEEEIPVRGDIEVVRHAD